MQAWWAEETSLNNIKNITVQKLLTGSVYFIYIVVVVGRLDQKMPGPIFFVPVQPWLITSLTSSYPRSNSYKLKVLLFWFKLGQSTFLCLTLKKLWPVLKKTNEMTNILKLV